MNTLILGNSENTEPADLKQTLMPAVVTVDGLDSRLFLTQLRLS